MFSLGGFYLAVGFNGRLFVEMFLGFAAIGSLLLFPAVRAWMRGLGAMRLSILGAFVAMMFLAQYTKQKRRWFPFIFWYMYSVAPEQDFVMHQELRATLVDGSTLILNPSRLLQHKFSTGLTIWLERALKGDPSSVNAFNRVLASFALAHDRFGSGLPIQRIEVVRVFHRFQKGAAEPEPEKVLWVWEVTP